MDLVSAIVPCYNVSPFVDKLSWIFAQTYPELEVVLIDDGSTDDTWQKLQAFKQQHADRRIIIAQNEQNLGAGETRNHGFALSSGQYVCFWDADDQVYPLFVEKMLSKLKQDQADFVCCGYNTIDDQGVLAYHELLPELLAAQDDIDFLKQHVFQFDMVPWNKLVCRDFIQEHDITFPLIRISEDNAWILQLVLNANKIAFIDEPYYQHYVDNYSSLMHQNDLKVLGFNDVTQSCWDCINKLGFTSSLCHEWLMALCDRALYTSKGLTEDQQVQLFLNFRDYCQQHKIDLSGKDLPISYKVRLYRLLPNFGFFAKKREQMKREFYRGNEVYSNMCKMLALIKSAEARLKEKEERE